MRRNFIAIVLVALVAVGLAGCQSSAPGGHGGFASIPILTPDETSAAGLSTQEASDAYDLCVAKCAKCHKFYNPADYTQADWDLWMRKMSRKSKLKPAQEKLLTQYLGQYRARHP